MNKMSKRFFLFACAFGFLSVGLGAFGAHGLEDLISAEMLSVFQTGVQYQMFHVVALFVVGYFCSIDAQYSKGLVFSGYCFVFGIILFSGSLYALSISGISGLGIITPFGGLAFLLGWSLLFYSVCKKSSEKDD